MTINTERLLLIAADKAAVEKEMEDRVELVEYLRINVPQNWPPPLNDENSLKWYNDFLKKNSEGLGWGLWYFCLSSKNLLIGNGGFKGMPDENGVVEIGYSILPQFQKKGFATEAVNGLVEWAFKNEGVKKVIAHTLPELKDSINVLQKTGFDFAGEGKEMGTIKFVLTN